MEVMIVNAPFSTEVRTFNPGEVYLSTPKIRKNISAGLLNYALKNNVPKVANNARFVDIDSIFKKASKDGNFKNLLVLRSGGIGDLIALTSIIDYFSDCKIHFVTQSKYFPLFDWFIEKPVLYSLTEPFLKGFKQSELITKYSNWARFQAEGVIENGHDRNWMELFFSFVDEHNPDIEMLRPQLNPERISKKHSNISPFLGKSLLICNKATAMMRTCNLTDIIDSLPEKILSEYTIYAYQDNCSKDDLKHIASLSKKAKIVLIGKTDLSTFFLDCFDADWLISVDTGALHFREAVNKRAIGLYNSFTADSRTKYYKYTKSVDIKSNCKHMPCFLHETASTRYCQMGKEGMFAAPCFDSVHNSTLIKQLKTIFLNYL